jgi:4-amino-4-deoxy-L-arabinose transferase-like glycosyltransferase
MSSRKKKKHKPSRKPVQAPPKKRIPVIWLALAIVAAVGAAILVTVNLRSNGPNQNSNSDAAAPQTQSSAAAGQNQGFDNLIGRWLRPDGGYIIEIRSISADGRMDAVYLNPRSIHVARAEASWKKGRQAVFIELQDTGYPGSTYTLDYNPDQDIFTGVYFQAAIKKGFEVVFVRQN